MATIGSSVLDSIYNPRTKTFLALYELLNQRLKTRLLSKYNQNTSTRLEDFSLIIPHTLYWLESSQTCELPMLWVSKSPMPFKSVWALSDVAQVHEIVLLLRPCPPATAARGPAASPSLLSVFHGICNAGYGGTGLMRHGSRLVSTSVFIILGYALRKTHVSGMARPCTHRNLVSGVPRHVAEPLSILPTNSDQYVTMLQRSVKHVIGREEADRVVSVRQRHSSYSQKDCHLPGRVFPGRMISRVLWPARSLDLTSSSFSCQGTWTMSSM